MRSAALLVLAGAAGVGLGVAVASPVLAACPAAPRPACRAGERTSFDVRRPTDVARARLAWKLVGGPATSQRDIGDPTTTTGYALCAWNDAGLLLDATLPAGALCDGKPCWKRRGASGFAYHDPAGSAGGLRTIALGGPRAKLTVQGKGGSLPDLALPLVGPVTVQLLRDDAPICFESVFVGASFVGGDPTRSTAKTRFDPTAPVPPLASAGCGAVPAWPAGTSTADALEHDALTRTFRVYVPSGYDPAVPTPVVMLLHGGFGSGAQIETSSNFVPVAEAERFVVVSPDGVPSPGGVRTWNAGGCCGYATANAIDDVGFVRALVDRLETGACVDRRRVYATGMSNGAMLAHRLGCDLADRIRAIAPVAGTDMAIGCAPARPVPLLEVHGSADGHVPFDGGFGCGPAGVSFTSVPATVAHWRDRDGCGLGTSLALVEGDGTCTRQDDCPLGADVELCVIANGGHQWPGGEPPSVSGTGSCPFGYQSETFSAPRVIWDFFAAHPPR